MAAMWFFDVDVFYGGWLTVKWKDLTGSSVDLYRRRIIFGKIPPQKHVAMAWTVVIEAVAAVGI